MFSERFGKIWPLLTAVFDKCRRRNSSVIGRADRNLPTPIEAVREFEYLLDKIDTAEICTNPFNHLHIVNFLNEKHLSTILQDDQIHFEACENTRELIRKIKSRNYVVQGFPGCVTNIEEYLDFIESGEKKTTDATKEGCGIAFRIQTYKTPIISNLMMFLNGSECKAAMIRKFKVQDEAVILTAIQKYLTGYAISPHPDGRQKCMTYLLNINKDDSVSEFDVHTHLLKFKPEKSFIYDAWKKNSNRDRCWVPWEWCETVKKN